jgi:hypothetical protein
MMVDVLRGLSVDLYALDPSGTSSVQDDAGLEGDPGPQDGAGLRNGSKWGDDDYFGGDRYGQDGRQGD